MLYNKYRPVTFDNVCGQEAALVLKNQVISGKVGHAYLLTGVRGTGKTTCAKILARAVNCSHTVNGSPCGVCDSCKNSIANTNPDILEIDGASNNGVDNIRDLIKNVSYSALNKVKVYIIDEVHMLSSSAFNAMLKTLEEPPANSLFILATTELNKVPATVRSRCQILNFTNIPEDVISERIKYVSQEEGFNFTDEGINLLAKEANGSLRDALSVLESLNGEITKKNIEDSLGLISFEKISTLYNSLVKVDKIESIQLALNLLKNGVLGQEVIERLSQLSVDNLLNIEYLSVNEMILSESILAINNIRAGLSDKTVLMHFIIKVCQNGKSYVKNKIIDNKESVQKNDDTEELKKVKTVDNLKEKVDSVKTILKNENAEKPIMPQAKTSSEKSTHESNFVDVELGRMVENIIFNLSPIIKKSVEDITAKNGIITIGTDLFGKIFLEKNIDTIKGYLKNNGIQNDIVITVK